MYKTYLEEGHSPPCTTSRGTDLADGSQTFKPKASKRHLPSAEEELSAEEEPKGVCLAHRTNSSFHFIRHLSHHLGMNLSS